MKKVFKNLIKGMVKISFIFGSNLDIFLAARLISVRISQNKIKLNFNYLFMTSNNLNR